MTNTKQLEWLGAIDDELIITAERAGIKRPARAYLKLLPIAAAMLALITLAVAVLPGMIKGDDPVGTEGKFLSITDIPGAVVVKDYDIFDSNSKPHPYPTDLLIDLFKDGTFDAVIGTVQNVTTVSVPAENFGKTIDFSGSSDEIVLPEINGKWIITSFDIVVSQAISDVDNNNTIKCITVYLLLDKGSTAVRGASNINTTLNLENDQFFMLSSAFIDDYTFQHKSFDFSPYADYIVCDVLEYDENSFKYHGSTINYTDIVP